MKKYHLFILFVLIHGITLAQSSTKSKVRIGAYYFGGWTSATDFHITSKLRDTFPERRPLWGWVSTSAQTMKTQIDLAADAGLSFFNFDWYYPNDKPYPKEVLNSDLGLYLQAPNKSRLKFCLFVANHVGYRVGPKDWAFDVDYWIKLFKDKDYLKVNNKPYISFFSQGDMIYTFGSIEAVHKALDSLRQVAKANGLGGVTIAICVSPEAKKVAEAKACGFDTFTAYNYPTVGFKKGQNTADVDSLLAGNKRIWDRFLNFGLPYIPVSTLNWDPRPWRKAGSNQDARYYTGYSAESIRKSILAVQKWVDDNPAYTYKDKIAMVYAWNEIGEGGYMMPTKDFNPLIGVEQALIYR